jgi:hypothetical protein
MVKSIRVPTSINTIILQYIQERHFNIFTEAQQRIQQYFQQSNRFLGLCHDEF